jgi:hypothetical protein
MPQLFHKALQEIEEWLVKGSEISICWGIDSPYLDGIGSGGCPTRQRPGLILQKILHKSAALLDGGSALFCQSCVSLTDLGHINL